MDRPTTHERIAVIGAGFMGGGIAAEFAVRLATCPGVTIWDPRPEAALAAVARAGAVAHALTEAGIITDDIAISRITRLHSVETIEEAVADATYIVEAVPENLAVKQAIFQAIDQITGPEVILASNTSGFDPADLTHGLIHPARVVVAHYFGPAYLIPLVEVVPHPTTDPVVVDRTVALLRATGKRPAVVTRFVPGFVANRLQQALFREALYLVREGIATPEVIDDIVRFSFGPRLAALGPFTVADFAGLDVYAALATNVWPSLAADGSTAPPAELLNHLEEGTVGVKAGDGTYHWTPERVAAMTARRDRALTRALRHAEE